MLKLATDAAPEVRLQVAIAARKLEGVDAMRLLLDVQQSSCSDPLIAPIVWQNLLPSIVERQAELTERLAGNRGKPPGLTTLIPRTIERLLEGKGTRRGVDRPACRRDERRRVDRPISRRGARAVPES